MKFIPHEYQRYGVDFICMNPVSCLLLDMGLGKTVITLTAIEQLIYDSFEVRKVLVIAPLRVARDVWPEEIRKWDHLRGLRYSVAIGTEAERRAALWKPADIYLINRENVTWLLNDSGVAFDFDMLVVDELSSFKDHQTKRFKALVSVRPRVKRVVGLTGTPASNGLMNLWAEYRLLDMGQRLGRFIGRYREAYFEPDRRNANVIFSYKPLPFAEEEIYRKISDITVSMKAADYLQMPELLTVDHQVYMSAEERERYETLKRDLVLPLAEGEITAANAAVLSGKLCQMANGAIYDESRDAIHIHDRKLDMLEDLIEAANGKPVLVAYWFQHDLTRICERLKKSHILFVKLDNAESIRRWNNGEYPVALIHPASAGHGLNLQAGGSALIWFSVPWSLELYQQTNARLWRQGQKAASVIVHHIVAAGTIDEQIIKTLAKKDETQSALIEAVRVQLTKPINDKTGQS